MGTTTIAISEIINLSQGLATLNLGYLGISVTIIALLGGFFYLFNVKPLKDTLSKQESALKDLEKDIKNSFVKAEENLNNNINIFRKNYSEELTVILKQREDKIISDIKSQIAVLDKDLSQKIDIVAKEKDENLKIVLLSEIGNQIRILEKNLTKNIDEYKASNDKESSLLKLKVESGLRELNITVRELEAFKYHTEGKMGGIIALIDVLEDCIKYKPHLLEFRLKDLKERIKEYPLDKDLNDRLKEILSKIKGKEHDKIIAEIESTIVLKDKE